MLAIIPARGGSKRLPDKNLRLLNGKPLIAYTIEAALNVKDIEKILVSTDDDRIAKIALDYGIEVPELRPLELSTDEADSLDVIQYGWELMEKIESKYFAQCILLQPTSPLRTSAHIEAAWGMYQSKSAKCVISFTKEHHPLYWNKYLDEEGKIQSIEIDQQKISYYPNGAVYIMDKSILMDRNLYNQETYAYIMDRKSSVDIDTAEDFEYCEYIIKNSANN